LLGDRCAGKKLAHWLVDTGYDVVDASAWTQDPGDVAIVQRALDDDRILIWIRDTKPR